LSRLSAHSQCPKKNFHQPLGWAIFLPHKNIFAHEANKVRQPNGWGLFHICKCTGAHEANKVRQPNGWGLFHICKCKINNIISFYQEKRRKNHNIM